MITPRVRTHPQDFKNAIPGKPVSFTAEATGTQPLSYHWEWKPAVKAEEKGSKQEEWQPCDADNSSTLTIPSVQKSHEGSYCCVISNCAGKKASNSAELSFGKNSFY